MAFIRQVDGVILFTALLYNDRMVLEEASKELEKCYGRICLKSPEFLFKFTDYYEPEMGRYLKKIFLAFDGQIHPGELASIKISTNDMEDRFSIHRVGERNRRVNIDPGYVGKAGVVLASTKNRSQRIYLDKGIYAEVTLIYEKGGWRPLPWTYPDYRTELAFDFFLRLREPIG